MLMLLVGGALALGVRWQLAFPWKTMPIIGQMHAVLHGRSTPRAALRELMDRSLKSE